MNRKTFHRRRTLTMTMTQMSFEKLSSYKFIHFLLETNHLKETRHCPSLLYVVCTYEGRTSSPHKCERTTKHLMISVLEGTATIFIVPRKVVRKKRGFACQFLRLFVSSWILLEIEECHKCLPVTRLVLWCLTPWNCAISLAWDTFQANYSQLQSSSCLDF